MFKRYVAQLFIAILFIVTVFSGLSHAQGIHTIEGRVVDENSRPVYNAYVELYNTYNTLLDRTRSSSQGRFTFRRVPYGRFTISVKPYNTNLLEDTQDVEFRSHTVLSPEFEFVEFRLRVDKRFTNQNPQVTGTVFAQEVPDEARKKFNSGQEKLRSQNEKGIDDLEAAIKIFPTYFEALSTLGIEYVSQGKYNEGYKILLRAIDVYPRCGDCFYSLGVAFYKLGEIPAGLRAVNAAILLNPTSPDVHLLQGILLRLSNDNAAAEKTLLKAESLYDKPNPEIHWQLSLVYNKMGKNNEAAEQLELYLRGAVDLDKKQKDSIKDLIVRLRATK